MNLVNFELVQVSYNERLGEGGGGHATLLISTQKKILDINKQIIT